MALLVHKTDPAIWGIWKIEESIDELFSMLSNQPEYISFIEGKSVENRKKEWLAVRVLLKVLLGKSVSIAYHPNGAPYLPDASYHISISHTKGYVAVILHPDAPVGIDIEHISERIFKVRDRFMSPEEILAIDQANEVYHLLVHWCAKETLFKVMGEANVDFREMLHINPFTFQSSGQFYASETCTPDKKNYHIHYLVTDGFVLTYTINSF